MLKIRLQRKGKKKHVHFNVVVTEHTTAPKGKYIELLGSYDPHQNVFNVNADRVKHWLAQGAQASDTVHNLMITHKVIEGEKRTSWKRKKKEEEAKPEEKKEENPAQEPAEKVEDTPKEE